MRQPQNGKTSRENISLTIGKKKNARKSKRASNRRKSRVTMENLECINDSLGFRQACGLHGTWKLVPKDSCQVYKDQRKRQDNTKTNKDKTNGKTNCKRSQPGHKGGQKGSSERDHNMSDDESRYSREKPVKVSKKVKKSPKKKRGVRRPKRACSHESMYSCTTHSETSMSSTPSSDMDL